MRMHEQLHPLLQGSQRVLVVGTIASGKTSFIESISRSVHLAVYRLDDARHLFNAATIGGEESARTSFLNTMAHNPGVFECTGAGPLHPHISAISSRAPFDAIIRVHTPVEICLQRCAERREWPPYPTNQMPDRELIKSIDDELDRHGFASEENTWKDQSLIHVQGW